MDVDRDLAANELLPALDLTLQPGFDSGSGAIGSQGKAGISLSVPLQRRTARGKLSEAELKAEKLRQELRQISRLVQTEVDDSASAMDAAARRYTAAVREADAAGRLEAAERERLALGEGNLFLVNQRERATAEALVKTINIAAEWHQALAAFNASAGDIAQSSGSQPNVSKSASPRSKPR